MDHLGIRLVVIDSNFAYIDPRWNDIDSQTQDSQTTVYLSWSFEIIVVLDQDVFYLARYIRFHLGKNQLLVAIVVQFLEKFVRYGEYTTQSKTNKPANHMEHAHYSVPGLLVFTSNKEDHINEEP